MCCDGLKPKPSPPPIIASLSLFSDTTECHIYTSACVHKFCMYADSIHCFEPSLLMDTAL